MIEYVIPQSPDDRVLKKAYSLLDKDQIVVFPTDTNWVMTARFNSKKAIDQLYKIKGEQKSHHFSLLCSDLSMASEVAVITDSSFRFMKGLIPGHFTFILEAQRKMTKFLQASKTDKEIGVRFPPNNLTKTLLAGYGHALLSTNLSPKMLGLDEGFEPYGHLIDEQFGHAVGMIIDPGEYDFSGQSTVISLVGDEVEILRQGSGVI